MLRSDDLRIDPKPIVCLCAAAYRRFGSNPRVILGEVVNDVMVVLWKKGLLEPGKEFNEAFILETARRVILAKLRELKGMPLPLIGEFPDDPPDAAAELVAESSPGFWADRLIEKVRGEMPQIKKVERIARELKTVRERQREALEIARKGADIVMRLILRLAEQGMTQKEIGRLMELSRDAVARKISRFYETVRLEYERLKAS